MNVPVDLLDLCIQNKQSYKKNPKNHLAFFMLWSPLGNSVYGKLALFFSP